MKSSFKQTQQKLAHLFDTFCERTEAAEGPEAHHCERLRPGIRPSNACGEPAAVRATSERKDHLPSEKLSNYLALFLPTLPASAESKVWEM